MGKPEWEAGREMTVGELDSRDFDRWFEEQKFSFGVMPTWTTVEHMRRAWLVARATLREAPDAK